MRNKLISFILALTLLMAAPLSAIYKYNPYTRKLDYYERVQDSDLADLGDVTFAGVVNGDIIIRQAGAWQNLGIGAGGQFLSVVGGLPAWAAVPAGVTTFIALTDTPGAYAGAALQLLRVNAATNAVEFAAYVALPSTIGNVLTDHNLLAHTALGLFDASADVDHNLTTNYAANQHVVLPGTIANVLSDHNLLAHTALGLFDASADVDHNATTNYLAAQHLTLPATIVTVLTDHNKAAHDALLIDADTVDGEHAAAIVTNARVKAHFPDTIANILSDHNLLAHTALGLFDASSDVDHDLTTNYVANQHINWTAAADNFSTSEDFFLAWTEAADHAAITQTAVAGVATVPLINIDDDRTGVTADTVGESTIYLDAEGVYALYIANGASRYAETLYADNTTGMVFTDPIGADTTLTLDWAGDNYPRLINSGGVTANTNFSMSMILTGNLSMGNNRQITIDNINYTWDNNGTGDDLSVIFLAGLAATDSAAQFYSNVGPNNMTDHDDYLTATFVLANSQGADAGDYAGVVIGERTQANVKVAHYFDFYAMTGATDGSVVSADELGATFRFGDSGSAIPDDATGPGDVLFEDDVEVDGNQWNDGYNRFATVFWVDCFDHGTVASKYQFDWDITSLNTLGNGTNTVDTTPSEITLTTDNNAIGDNEGTRTEFTVIQRARQNRTEWSLDLKQTANTQFYMGWNTSGTNAMVAAADEYVIVFFDVSDNANWQIKVGDGATEDVFTSAVAGAVAHITHEIWVETDGTVHWAVNGTEIDITGTVDNLMTASNHYLIVGQAESVTGAAVIVVEIDYVENEKTKVH